MLVSALVAPAPRRRQGGVAARRRKPARRRHLAEPGRDRPAHPLRRALPRQGRDGEPYQGVPARPVRRPHLGNRHVRQPASPLVRLDGLVLCPARRPETHRPRRNPPRQSHMRLDPPQAPQNRRSGPAQRKAYPRRHGLRLPPRRRVRTRTRPIIHLTPAPRPRPNPPDNNRNTDPEHTAPQPPPPHSRATVTLNHRTTNPRNQPIRRLDKTVVRNPS